MNARFALVIAAALALSPAAHAQVPPIRTGGLGQGPYANMSALVEKTIFAIDIFRVSIMFGDDTARDLASLARGHRYSEQRADRIAGRAYRADNAYVRIVFQRDIDFDDFLDGVRENLEKARKAGMISANTESHVSRALPNWFSFLNQRGIRQGEQILYRAYPDKLRTVYLDTAGRELFDQTDMGKTPPMTMLAGYFAPGVDARERLVRSLFD